MKKKFFRTNVAGLLFNESGKVLLCQRSRSKRFLPELWHVPGGRVEEDESFEQAITREFSEELSLSVQKTTRLNTTFIYQDEQESCTRFLLVEATGKPRLNDENQALRFLSEEDIPNYIQDRSLEPTLQAIAEARRYREKLASIILP